MEEENKVTAPIAEEKPEQPRGNEPHGSVSAPVRATVKTVPTVDVPPKGVAAVADSAAKVMTS